MEKPNLEERVTEIATVIAESVGLDKDAKTLSQLGDVIRSRTRTQWNYTSGGRCTHFSLADKEINDEALNSIRTGFKRTRVKQTLESYNDNPGLPIIAGSLGILAYHKNQLGMLKDKQRDSELSFHNIDYLWQLARILDQDFMHEFFEKYETDSNMGQLTRALIGTMAGNYMNHKDFGITCDMDNDSESISTKKLEEMTTALNNAELQASYRLAHSAVSTKDAARFMAELVAGLIYRRKDHNERIPQLLQVARYYKQSEWRDFIMYQTARFAANSEINAYNTLTERMQRDDVRNLHRRLSEDEDRKHGWGEIRGALRSFYKVLSATANLGFDDVDETVDLAIYLFEKYATPIHNTHHAISSFALSPEFDRNYHRLVQGDRYSPFGKPIDPEDMFKAYKLREKLGASWKRLPTH